MGKDQKYTQQIIAACLRRGRIMDQKSAEKRLYDLFAPQVMTICRRYAWDKHSANDFFQECFIRMFDKLNNYNPSKGPFEGWLYRVCVNQCLVELRKKKKTMYDIDISALNDLADEKYLESKVDAELLIQAIQRLPDGYREVFNLYMIEGWRHQEIADKMQIQIDTSRSQLSRAKSKIRGFINRAVKSSYEKGMV